MTDPARPAPRVASVPGGLLVEAAAYRLRVDAERPLATLETPAGERLGRLVLLAAVDAADGLDGATYVASARIDEGGTPPGGDAVRIVVEAGSTRWAAKRVTVTCRPDELEVAVEVEGWGALTDVRLLAGRHAGGGGWGSGMQRSRIDARTMVSPNPEDPRRIALSPAEPTTIGVVGGGGIGRGHWFFTPAPLCLAFSAAPAPGPAVLPGGPWTAVGIAAPLAELTFTDLLYEPLDSAFGLRLAYDGHTAVDGSWRSPGVVVRPGAPDPYAGLAAYAAGLVERGMAPGAADPAGRPAWWSEPIFCGWGAQCHLATLDGSHPASQATQAAYDSFLAGLAARGIDPGTIVIDDRWQRTYGTGEPDTERWPDLPGWIAARHAEGRRVLLWWKAWDPDGLPPELCVTTATGRPVTVDPTNPAYVERVRSAVRRLLAPPPDGLDADGLKIDFTALTPSGPGLRRHGSAWGIALLHRLLATIHSAAKEARPDAFVVAHAPNPAFADVADAVRLNDILRLDDPDRNVPVVAQMRHRAAVARAACPGLLVETDDWGMPDLVAWREYLAMKAELGIPSLYYVEALDLSGERLTDGDAEAVRRVWADWRRREGLPERPAPAGRPASR